MTTAASPIPIDRRFTLNRKRVAAVCGILLAVEIALFLFLAAGTHGLVVPMAKPTSTDFVSFYAAGRLADAGTPQQAYDQAAHYAAEEQATRPGITYNYFFYPPTFLLLCATLARLPYMAAFVVFEAATLALYLIVARQVLAARERNVLLPLLAFPPVLWTIGLGQNALLTAALFGAATLLIDRRPLVAGLLFGALCYKPHFGLLVPVALVAGRRWPALVAACCAVTALSLLSLLLFGPQTWHAYLSAMAASHEVYESGRIDFAGYVTPFGAMMLMGAGREAAYVAQIVVTVAAAALVANVWRRGLPLPIRAAILAAATLAAVPLALFYDLMIAAIAGLWLLRAEGAYRLPEWGKIALAVLYMLTLDPRGLGQAVHLPIGPFVALGMTSLVATLALRPTGTRILRSGRFLLDPRPREGDNRLRTR